VVFLLENLGTTQHCGSFLLKMPRANIPKFALGGPEWMEFGDNSGHQQWKPQLWLWVLAGVEGVMMLLPDLMGFLVIESKECSHSTQVLL
jgi:hypothetical protein